MSERVSILRLRAYSNNPLASTGCVGRGRRQAVPARRDWPASPSLPTTDSLGLGPTRGYSDRLLLQNGVPDVGVGEWSFLCKRKGVAYGKGEAQ